MQLESFVRAVIFLIKHDGMILSQPLELTTIRRGESIQFVIVIVVLVQRIFPKSVQQTAAACASAECWLQMNNNNPRPILFDACSISTTNTASLMQ